jgi:hypothetical protein
MTMHRWVQFCRDLRDSYGPEARWHELPLGVLEAEKKRSEAAKSSEREQASRSVRLLGGTRHTSTAPAVPTARTRRAE